MVSIVIPLYKPGSYLPKLLRQLSVQTLEHELILISSDSEETTDALIDGSGATVVRIRQSEFNHGKTRNLGVKLARFNIVVFLTQDALPSSVDTLERLVSPLTEKADVVMAYGRQLPYESTRLFGRLARNINYPSQSLVKNKSLIPKLGIRTCSCSNSFAAYKKLDLLSIGGFPETTILGEDVSVAARFILQDKAIAYVADAEVYHSHDYTLKEEFKRYFDIGVFHMNQQEVISQFQRAESEGFKFVKDEIAYLKEQHKMLRIPELIARTAAKYIGYSLGLSEKYVPVWIKRHISMHPHHWPKVCK